MCCDITTDLANDSSVLCSDSHDVGITILCVHRDGIPCFHSLVELSVNIIPLYCSDYISRPAWLLLINECWFFLSIWHT